MTVMTQALRKDVPTARWGLRELIGDLYAQDPAAAKAVAIAFLLAIGSALSIPFDPRLVMNLSPWIKPMKFSFSFVLFIGTMGFLLPTLSLSEKARRRISLGFIAIAFLELGCIFLQAARGTTSHFNNSTAFDAGVFSAMGIGILINTVLLVYVGFVAFTRPMKISGAVAWGVRAGLLLILLSLVDGVIMVTLRAHTIGLPDGGPGLPLLNWSTRAGDLRISHFLSLHALQVMPLLGMAVDRARARFPRLLVVTFATLYVLAIGGFLALALLGRPAFAM